MDSKPVIGRFAPSPTGPLHFGSLVAALASCLSARSRGGKWLVRIEDIDQHRCRPDFEFLILRQLETLGFVWDGPILRQSDRIALYRDIFLEQQCLGAVYPCACTRAEVLEQGTPGIDSTIYSGRCRQGIEGKSIRSWRFKVPAVQIAWTDRFQGECRRSTTQFGDFVVFRGDGFFSYHWAVVIDDHLQGVTEIIRGADLLESTARHIVLQQELGFHRPIYGHFPIAILEDGHKLSKANQAPSISEISPAQALFDALVFLGQEPDPFLVESSVTELWGWAMSHWNEARLPQAKKCLWKNCFPPLHMGST